MDHLKILKRAGQITWLYRALWVFGIILALTTAGGSAAGGGGSGRGGGNNGGESSMLPRVEVPAPVVSVWNDVRVTEVSVAELNLPGWVIAVAVGGACLLLILMVLGVIGRYISETALIRMVDEYEGSGREYTIRQGFRLGWSRSAWRLFLIDLLVMLPVVLAFLFLFALSLSPLLLLATGQTVAGVAGVVTAIGFFFVVVVLAILVAVMLAMLVQFYRRTSVLDGQDVIDSIRQGYAMVRRHLKDVGIMWLLMIGVRLAWSILLVPAVFVLIAAGGLLGGLAALAIGGLVNLFAASNAAWTAGLVAGGLVFLPVFFLPLVFLSGLYETFKSSTWTLTFRELRAMEGVEAEQSSQPPVPVPA